MPAHKFVLYVNYRNGDPSSLCAGSTHCMKYVNARVNVQNVSDLLDKGHSLPHWLNGTPIVVDVDSKRAHKGNNAIRVLRDYAGEREEAERESAEAEKEAPPPPDDPFTMLVSEEEQRKMESYETREKKVTDDDVSRLMKQREASASAPAHSQEARFKS